MFSRLSLSTCTIYLVAIFHFYLNIALCAPTTDPPRPLDVSLGPLAIREDELAAEHGSWLYTSLVEYTDDLIYKTLPDGSATGKIHYIYPSLLNSNTEWTPSLTPLRKRRTTSIKNILER